MGKKKPKNRQLRVPGPNCQVKPAKPAPPPDSNSSDESMILDEPVEFESNYNASSSDSDNEMSIKKEAIRVKVQQIYKDPAMAAHRYGPPLEEGISVVSASAHPDNIDYQITFENVVKKERKSYNKPWAESIYQRQPRNKNPSPSFQRFKPAFVDERPCPSQAMAPPPPRNHPISPLSRRNFESLSLETKEPEQELEASDEEQWETASMGSMGSSVWDNDTIKFG